LVRAEDVPAPNGLPLHIREPLDGARVRRAVAFAAKAAGLGPSCTEDLCLAAGEAASNVLKHAGEGCAHIWHDGPTVYVRISDSGNGISAEDIPKALKPGWSSEVSLGMGFTLMMEMADALWLATGATGTTICIEKSQPVGGAAQPAQSQPQVSGNTPPQ
jgi:anti-sigma regulatory factor (Ser/Thr protein kinase)